MRISIIAVGSRGDVSPMLALGVGLRESGHQVRLAALDPFKQLARAQALEFTSLGALPSRFTRPKGWIPVPTFTGLSGRALFWAAYNSMLGPRLTRFYEACLGADAVIFGGLAFPAYHAAEAVGARSFWASPVPHTPTREFVDPFFSEHRFARWGGGPRRLSYHAEEQLRLQCCARQIGRWRRETLGLAGIPRSNLAAHFRRTLAGVLYGCSAHLVPRPSDWPDSVHITGDWRLPPRARFLSMERAPSTSGLPEIGSQARLHWIWLDERTQPQTMGCARAPSADQRRTTWHHRRVLTGALKRASAT